ncbi:carboxymuconolactone decarboxylase family protein [Blautia schinkii]|nr:carboxymuconolactone decarboxylase family protein [Blautia schinkii]
MEKTKTRFENGMEQLQRIDGAGGEAVIQSLQDISPDLGRLIVEFAFGDIYTRKELNIQEREIITISSLLTAGGCEPQLEVHINGALNVGVTPQKVVETFLQCIPYTGFPKVLNAMFVARKVFEERGIEKNEPLS